MPRMNLRLEVDPATSNRLAQIRQFGTEPELLIRKVLRDLRVGYRTNNRLLPGTPDLANRAKKWAIFVHGCFWHHHKGCKRATVPRRNREFWVEKFRRNRERDARAMRALRRRGYSVVLIWECQTADRTSIEERLRNALNA